jgi:UPF0755 protein
MPSEPSWDDVFRAQPDAAEPTRGASGGGRLRRPDDEPPRKRGRRDRGSGDGRRRWPWVVMPLVLLIGVVGGGAFYAWTNFEPQIRSLIGQELPTDHEGDGNGEEVVVTVHPGDIGSDIATTLTDSGVTMTYDAFYDLLVQDEPTAEFTPGSYALEGEMSARSAFTALQDQGNRVTNSVLVIEGAILPDVLETLSASADLPLADFEAAVADLPALGIPEEAPSAEGYLFPATYDLAPEQTAFDIVKVMVDTMFQRLDAAGVAVEDRHRVLTMAGLIQREAGANPDDFAKISRVFTNRLDQGVNLESDATVAYGTGNLDTVWTEPEERDDAANLYNTYANPGLPIGPIGAPGDVAIDAALNPTAGDWVFFVPIDLETGETVFSATLAEHEAAVEVLRQWCRDTDSSRCD